METKHTPGPWICEVSMGADDWLTSVRIEAPRVPAQVGSVMLENFDGRPEDRQQAIADGNLMAAAPELLAACESMLLTLDSFAESLGFKRSGHHCAEAAREAIAKARYGIQ